MAMKSNATASKRPRAAVDTSSPDALLHGNAVQQLAGISGDTLRRWVATGETDGGSTVRRALDCFMQAASRFIDVTERSDLDATVWVTHVEKVRDACIQARADPTGRCGAGFRQTGHRPQ
jgi:hypothetical protein